MTMAILVGTTFRMARWRTRLPSSISIFQQGDRNTIRMKKFVTHLTALSMTMALNSSVLWHGGENNEIEIDHSNVKEHPLEKPDNPTNAVQTIRG